MLSISRSAEETKKHAAQMARRDKNKVLCLYGDLGAGKTTFVQGLAQGLGIRKQVQSPTFTYSRIYEGRKKLYHFDFYRLSKRDELLIGELLEAYEKGDGLIAIEWPERMQEHLPQKRAEIYFEYIDENERRLTFKKKS